MTSLPTEVHTGIAVLTRMRANLLEAHYRPGCIFNGASLVEVQRARRELMGATPYGMLSIIPHDADFELAAMGTDHLAQDRSEGTLLAIAVVTHANMLEMVMKLYFSYFPQPGRVLVTMSEDEARTWINAKLEELAGGTI